MQTSFKKIKITNLKKSTLANKNKKINLANKRTKLQINIEDNNKLSNDKTNFGRQISSSNSYNLSTTAGSQEKINKENDKNKYIDNDTIVEKNEENKQSIDKKEKKINNLITKNDIINKTENNKINNKWKIKKIKLENIKKIKEFIDKLEKDTKSKIAVLNNVNNLNNDKKKAKKIYLNSHTKYLKDDINVLPQINTFYNKNKKIFPRISTAHRNIQQNIDKFSKQYENRNNLKNNKNRIKIEENKKLKHFIQETHFFPRYITEKDQHNIIKDHYRTTQHWNKKEYNDIFQKRDKMLMEIFQYNHPGEKKDRYIPKFLQNNLDPFNNTKRLYHKPWYMWKK